MDKSSALVLRLHAIRNAYGTESFNEKSSILNALASQAIKKKKDLILYYETLLFLIAYPDSKIIYQKASALLTTLEDYIKNHQHADDSLYNSGVAGSQLCASFSFDIIKWLRKRYPKQVALYSIDAEDGQITSVLSVVMPKVESEILQDANADWKGWLIKTGLPGEDLLDKLIRIFDQTNIRPEVRDELWSALKINILISLQRETRLPASLTYPFYHRALIKSKAVFKAAEVKPIAVKLNPDESAAIIDCARMILVRNLREIDPITFTAPSFVSYYKLPRGLTVALFGMVPDRRHPIDCYMGYAAFKNGLPVAYAGSWVLFDSARIGLNVLPAYRGGESRHIFEEVMNLHKQVYHLKRFTVDPYQIGKHNEDGIHSGAFWLYYNLGFRPIKEKQKKLAEGEYAKVKSSPAYRTSAPVLRILADSRMELILNPKAVSFDAVDISIAYASILKVHFKNNRQKAEETAYNRLVKLLELKNPDEPNLNFVLRNWAVILMINEKELSKSKELKATLKRAFELKANGREQHFMSQLNQSPKLLRFIADIIAANA